MHVKNVPKYVSAYYIEGCRKVDQVIPITPFHFPKHMHTVPQTFMPRYTKNHEAFNYTTILRGPDSQA